MGRGKVIRHVEINVRAFFHDKGVGETDKRCWRLAGIVAIEYTTKKKYLNFTQNYEIGYNRCGPSPVKRL